MSFCIGHGVVIVSCSPWYRTCSVCTVKRIGIVNVRHVVSNTEVWDLMTLSSLDTSPLFRTLTLLYNSMIVVSCSVHVLRLQDTF